MQALARHRLSRRAGDGAGARASRTAPAAYDGIDDPVQPGEPRADHDTGCAKNVLDYGLDTYRTRARVCSLKVVSCWSTTGEQRIPGPDFRLTSTAPTDGSDG